MVIRSLRDLDKIEWDFGSEEEEPDLELSPSQLRKLRREFVFNGGTRIKQARLNDFRGMREVREKIERIISSLKNYKKLVRLGAHIPPGIFLRGRPGSGKTFAARIIATESGAELIDASKFPRNHNRWSAEDIHSLFSLARKYHKKTKKPVIVYFDRLEELGHRERLDGACTALLSEIDGIAGKHDGVIVVGASANDYFINDEILRAGRLGYQIHFPDLSRADMLEILEYYIGEKPHESIDTWGFARAMPEGMTPAEIEELVEASYVTACQEAMFENVKLRESDLFGQLIKKLLESPSTSWVSEADRYRACVHEAGHAIVGAGTGVTPTLVAVPKNGYKRGVTVHDGPGDLPSRKKIEADIAAEFGGGVAEEIVFGDCSFGGEEDIQSATISSIKLAAKWDEITNYWDLDDSSLNHNRVLGLLSEEERARVYAEARETRERCRRKAREILVECGKTGIERLAKRLMKREFLLGKELERAVSDARKCRD
jgi:ATP-dependent Zn protease